MCKGLSHGTSFCCLIIVEKRFGRYQEWHSLRQGCGVVVGRNFRWSRSRKEFLGGVGVGDGKNVPTPTSV
jgi:hypothetical protein